jgi:selenocysteine lyase/cysteine desulfurase
MATNNGSSGGPADGDEDIVYFDNAGMARFSPAVRQAGIRCIEHQLAGCDADAPNKVRESFAKLIDADPSRIALMASTAFAITLAAENLKATWSFPSRSGRPGKVLVIQDQFASAVYPWQTICAESNGAITLEIIPDPASLSSSSFTTTWTELIVDRLENHDDILVACLPPLHWADGHLIDLTTISALCRRRNIPLIVDATQAVGAVPVSVSSLRPALLVASAHKWLRGCAGCALAYIDPAYQDVWKPLDQHARGRNVGHCDRMGPDGYPGEYYKDARKFDCGGKPNPLLLPMLKASLEEVVALNVDELQATLKELLDPLLSWAVTSGKFILPKHHSYHLVGLKPVPPMSTDQMTVIADQLLRTKKIHLAVRAGGVFRISPYLDTTKEEVQILRDALAEAFPST